jgi:hypothetical protein
MLAKLISNLGPSDVWAALSLDWMSDAEEILKGLKRDGFRCLLDEKLVSQACGRAAHQKLNCEYALTVRPTIVLDLSVESAIGPWVVRKERAVRFGK